jgi:serine/threonine protein kinase
MQPASPPRVVGRYALFDEIAAGGMATVHLGRLLGPVGFARTVAIKRLHPHFAKDPEFVSMFLDEARLAARISHPNVVPTLDVVATEGELFLVMEYVRGESLARLIRIAAADKAPIPPPVVATLMIGVLHGLHAAHEAKNERGIPLGIVHRDVSPHNILVGIDGVARVLDFGVAKAIGRIQTTREGQVKGKLSYMAPEQTHGRADRTSDVYAASVVMWEALTGKRLFGGENDAEILRRVLDGRVVPPSRHAVDIPRALDAITLKALSTDPSKRFATAREMAVALEDVMQVVSTSKIARWVETTAAQTLTDRDKRIALIENDSSIQLSTAQLDDDAARQRHAPTSPAMPAAPRAGSAGVAPALEVVPAASAVRVAPVSASRVVTDDMIQTQLSSGSVSAPGRALTVRPALARKVTLTLGGGVVVVATLLLAIGLHHPAPGTTVKAGPGVPTASIGPSQIAPVVVASTSGRPAPSPMVPPGDVADTASASVADGPLPETNATTTRPIAQGPRPPAVRATGAATAASPLAQWTDVVRQPPPSGSASAKSAAAPSARAMPSARAIERVLDSRQ